MVRQRDPFGRALSALREQLRGGVHDPGQALTIADLAKDLQLSPTPIREALSRLAGEGLVEDRRGRGYFTWRLDSNELAQAYEFQDLLVGGAALRLIERSPAGLPPVARAPDQPPRAYGEALDQLFRALLRLAGNQALQMAYGLLSDRLASLRVAEASVLDNADAELTDIAEAASLAQWREVAELLAAFHVRRRQCASEIIAWIRAGPA